MQPSTASREPADTARRPALRKALALFSGGLDSVLAVCVVRRQVETQAVHFHSLFTDSDVAGQDLRAVKMARQLGVPLRVEDNGDDLLALVKNPRHGHGSNMNPCIDCRIRNLRRAGEIMREIGADFLVTGEVLGQRPMSQNRGSMRLIDKESGLDGLILRPLCARLLEPTVPEEKGWIARERLLDLAGRSRKRQMELAREWGIKEYPSPAGGCRLTDPEFSARMRDLLAHNPACDMNDVSLLRFGRHFRLSDRVKAVVGRNHEENLALRRLARAGDRLLEAATRPGPLALLRGPAGEAEILLAGGIAMRYGKAASLPSVPFRVWSAGAEGVAERTCEVFPADEGRMAALRVGLASADGSSRRKSE